MNLKNPYPSNKRSKVTVPAAVEGIKGSVEKWQQSTEPNKERMEKEIEAIQTALEKLEQTITATTKIIIGFRGECTTRNTYCMTAIFLWL